MQLCTTSHEHPTPDRFKQNLRTILLIAIVISCGGTYVLEQPNGSLMEYFPRFRWMLQQLVRWGGDRAAPLPWTVCCLLFALPGAYNNMVEISALPR